MSTRLTIARAEHELNKIKQEDEEATVVELEAKAVDKDDTTEQTKRVTKEKTMAKTKIKSIEERTPESIQKHMDRVREAYKARLARLARDRGKAQQISLTKRNKTAATVVKRINKAVTVAKSSKKMTSKKEATIAPGRVAGPATDRRVRLGSSHVKCACGRYWTNGAAKQEHRSPAPTPTPQRRSPEKTAQPQRQHALPSAPPSRLGQSKATDKLVISPERQVPIKSDAGVDTAIAAVDQDLAVAKDPSVANTVADQNVAAAANVPGLPSTPQMIVKPIKAERSAPLTELNAAPWPASQATSPCNGVRNGWDGSRADRGRNDTWNPAAESALQLESKASSTCLVSSGGSNVDTTPSVRVMVRIKPYGPEAEDEQPSERACLRVAEDEVQLNGDGGQVFAFDRVFGEQAGQEEVFRVAGKPIAENALAGFNASIFAYGQTGSGKTYTVQGRPEDEALRGLLPRVLEHCFVGLDKLRARGAVVGAHSSYLEIYNEHVYDLLEEVSDKKRRQPGYKQASKAVREDKKRGVYVEGAVEQSVTSVDEAIALVSRGARNRHVSPTDMNRESSRSHAIFTLVLAVRLPASEGRAESTQQSRVNLVDLAGSERQRTPQQVAARLAESKYINKSLSALGNVVSSLVERSKGRKQRHVPHRDSVLTYLLRDSLGGNTKTSVIATVSPDAANVQDTLSTLQFGQRAKRVRNVVKANLTQASDVPALRREIKRLRNELAKQQQQQQQQQQANVSDVDEQLQEALAARDKAEAAAQAERVKHPTLKSEVRRLMAANAELTKLYELKESDEDDDEAMRQSPALHIQLEAAIEDKAELERIVKCISEEKTRLETALATSISAGSAAKAGAEEEKEELLGVEAGGVALRRELTAAKAAVSSLELELFEALESRATCQATLANVRWQWVARALLRRA